MQAKIPILNNHQESLNNIIGFFQDGEVTMLPGHEIVESIIFNIFGTVSFEIIERLEDGRIKKFKIRNWGW